MFNSMTSGCYLYDDLVREVLVRLPTKSLLRFKSLSKPWRSSIEDPRFLRNSPKKLIIIDHELDKFKHESWLSSDLYSPGNLKKLILPGELYRDKKTSTLKLAGSCNGLILLRDYYDTHVWIWNPSTRECCLIDVPQVGGSSEIKFLMDRCFGFVYDSVNDDYKVIWIFSYHSNDKFITGAFVYSLRNNAWSRSTARKKSLTPCILLAAESGVLVGGNNKLHWIGYPYPKGKPYCILAFDVSTEEFVEIAALPKKAAEGTTFGYLGELGGCVTVTELSTTKRFSAVAFWALKECGWVELFRTSCVGLGRNTLTTPIAYSKTGQQVLIHDLHSFLWYNTENGKIDRLYSRKSGMRMTICLVTDRKSVV